MYPTHNGDHERRFPVAIWDVEVAARSYEVGQNRNVVLNRSFVDRRPALSQILAKTMKYYSDVSLKNLPEPQY